MTMARVLIIAELIVCFIDSASLTNGQLVCPRGQFRSSLTGSDCDGYCHCRDDVSCNPVTGLCPNMSCKAPWNGTTCSDCPVGRYRDRTKGSHNCDLHCHCKHLPCDYETGRCPGVLCDHGWTGISCHVRDCNVARGGCDQICLPNTVTDWCDCQPGFYKDDLDHTQCHDVNECATHNGGCDHTCDNTLGSYRCSCERGFRLQGDHQCQDIDECVTNNGDCDQECNNSIGSHNCSCLPGFIQSGSVCTDINECAVNNGECDHNCSNTPGSFICGCQAPFVLVNQLHCQVEAVSNTVIGSNTVVIVTAVVLFIVGFLLVFLIFTLWKRGFLKLSRGSKNSLKDNSPPLGLDPTGNRCTKPQDCPNMMKNMNISPAQDTCNSEHHRDSVHCYV